jgi:hypothetical protein
MKLYPSSHVDSLKDFLELINNNQVTLRFGVTRSSVDSPYRGMVSFLNITDETYYKVVSSLKWLGQSDILRKQSKNKWKKVIYSNNLLEMMYGLDGFHQMIVESGKKNPELKKLIDQIQWDDQPSETESLMMEVCEDLPF